MCFFLLWLIATMAHVSSKCLLSKLGWLELHSSIIYIKNLFECLNIQCSVNNSGAATSCTHTGMASRDIDQDDAPLSQKPEVFFFLAF